MEYLFHCHSDLYAGAKGQRRIGGRKTAARVQLLASRREVFWIVDVDSKSALQLIQWRRANCRDSLVSSRGGRRKEGWKKVCGKMGLLCIHLSLRINKGNLGWFFPVGLLADGRGERSDAAEQRGVEITSRRTRQITAPVWESLVVTVCRRRQVSNVKLQLLNRQDGEAAVMFCCFSSTYFSSPRSGEANFHSSIM